MWQSSKHQDKHYTQFTTAPGSKLVKYLSNKTDKLTLSIIIQLKMSHGYFRSYLKNILNEYTGRCISRCNEIQTPEHLLIKCIHYREEIEEMKKHLLIINITVLFDTKKELDLLIKYLKSTKIETRK